MADYANSYPYPREKVEGYYNLQAKSLAAAVLAAFPGDNTKVVCAGAEATVASVEALDQATLDGVVAAQKAAFDPLPIAKTAKVSEIRDNTKAFLARGLESDGLIYASTEVGRFDVMAIFTVGVVAATPGFFPKKVTTTDGTVEREFADAAAFIPFFTDISSGYDYWKSSSQTLRQQANGAASVAEVNAVVDDRTWPWTPT